MKYLKVNRGNRLTGKKDTYFVMVDDEDFDRLSKHKWHFAGNRGRLSKASIRTAIYLGEGKMLRIPIQNMIMNPPEGKVVDHISGNILDDRKSNLRICTPLENSRNVSMTTRNKSGYKGVSWHKQWKKWRSIICVNRKLVFLGYFLDKKEAARAYNEAAKKYFGEFAKPNPIQ